MTADGDGLAEDLVRPLQARVAEREAAGLYPPGLEEDLDGHFARIASHHVPAVDVEHLRSLLADLDRAATFDPARIRTDTRLPGGAAVHAGIAKLVGRQTSGVLEQVQEFATAARAVLTELLGAMEHPSAHDHVELLSRLDLIFERLASYERAAAATPELASLVARIEALERSAAER